MNVSIPNNWKPRPHQMPVWQAIEAGVSRIFLVWHRRAGKDSVMLNGLVTQAIKKPGLYWLMAPKANQSRKIYFENIGSNSQKVIDQAIPEAIRTRTDKMSMTIELVNGSIIQFVGSDNYDSLVGANPVGVVFTEWSLSQSIAWDYIRPILIENKGFAWFNGTPRGKNHFYNQYLKVKDNPDWFVQVLTVADTGLLTQEQIEKEIYEEGMTFDKAQQEFYCSFTAPVEGSYYSSILTKLERDGMIGDYAHSRMHPMYTAWDIGISDYTAIWFFQVYAGKRHYVHYYENINQDLSHYVNYCLNLPYRYGTHYLPHDVNQRQGALPGLPTRLTLLKNMGLMNIKVVPTGSGMLDAGIDAVTRELYNCTFDQKGCSTGLEKLHAYRRKYDEETHTYSKTPVHDAASDCADAFRMSIVGTSTISRSTKGTGIMVKSDYSVLEH